jgi:hypothetical protein
MDDAPANEGQVVLPSPRRLPGKFAFLYGDQALADTKLFVRLVGSEVPIDQEEGHSLHSTVMCANRLVPATHPQEVVDCYKRWHTYDIISKKNCLLKKSRKCCNICDPFSSSTLTFLYRMSYAYDLSLFLSPPPPQFILPVKTAWTCTSTFWYQNPGS